MAYKVISGRRLLTSRLVTRYKSHQFSAMHTTAMLDYECLNCYCVNARIRDETVTIVVENVGNGHYNQVSILNNGKVIANLRFTSSYIWRPCWFSICGGRWEYFTILVEILTVENVGIDTITKSLDSVIRKLFVIA